MTDAPYIVPGHSPSSSGTGCSPVESKSRTLTYSDLKQQFASADVFAGHLQRPVAQVKADIAALKRRLRQRDFMLIDPNSRFMQRWDLLTTVGLFYTAAISPFEVGFLEQEWPPDVLFCINQIFNVIFMMDLVVSFFVPVLLQGNFSAHVWIKTHRDIARQYIRGWFTIDLISALPYDVISIVIEQQSEQLVDFPLMTMKLVRLLRLTKLARVFRMSRILSRWDSKISLSYAQRDLIAWTTILLFVLHFFTCAWGIVAQLSPTLRTPELQAAVEAEQAAVGRDVCDGCPTGGLPEEDGPTVCTFDCLTACEVSLLANIRNVSSNFIINRESWLCRGHRAGMLRADRPVEAYFHALARWPYFTANLVDNIVYFVVYFISQFFWSMFIGTICGSVANLDPDTKFFKQTMDKINYFMRDAGVPHELRILVREYIRSTRDMMKRESYPSMLERMSPHLRHELVRQLSESTLVAVWYLREVRATDQGEALLVELAQLLERSAYCAKEQIKYAEAIHLVEHGVAGRGGEMLARRQFWGEDMIVTSVALRDMRSAKAITHVEVTKLSLAVLKEVLQNFPEATMKIRCAAALIATSRAMVLIAAHVNALKARRHSQLTKAQERTAGVEPEEVCVARKERDAILQSINGKRPWLDINSNGDVVDPTGRVLNEDVGMAAKVKTADDVHLILQEQLAELLRQQQQQSQQQQQLASSVAAMQEQLSKLVGRRAHRSNAVSKSVPTREIGQGSAGANGSGSCANPPAPADVQVHPQAGPAAGILTQHTRQELTC